MSEESAVVFDIEKFAVHDGPGIRSVVFIKGCPLRCLWCHNPESQASEPELLYNAEKCTSCGQCAARCPHACHVIRPDGTHDFDRAKCVRCGLCTEGCPSEALELAGRRMSVSDVLADVMKDQVFYESSGGGITLSGGEPLAHFSFTESLLKAAKQAGLHTAVETSGFASADRIAALEPLVDLWLWDVKASPEKHEKLTGVPAAPILANLEKLNRDGAEIVLRCPLVPGVNDSDEDLRHIAELANRFERVKRIDLEPYHPMGEGKSRNLGRKDIFRAPFASEEEKARWKQFLTSQTKTEVHL